MYFRCFFGSSGFHGFLATTLLVVLKSHTVFRGMPPGYRSVSAADVKHCMVLALRGVPLCDQGIKFITGGVTAVPSFSERGIRFIDEERGYGGGGGGGGGICWDKTSKTDSNSPSI